MSGDSAIVMNKAQLPELVHEEVHPGVRGAHHLREHVLADFAQDVLPERASSRRMRAKRLSLEFSSRSTRACSMCCLRSNR